MPNMPESYPATTRLRAVVLHVPWWRRAWLWCVRWLGVLVRDDGGEG